MKFFYHSSCPGIAPQVVAGIHLGILPKKRIPNQVEWERILNRTGLGGSKREGVLLLGRTNGGDEIYHLNYPPKPGPLVIKSVLAAFELMEVPQNELAVIDCGRIAPTIPTSARPPDHLIKKVYPLLVQFVENIEGGVIP